MLAVTYRLAEFQAPGKLFLFLIICVATTPWRQAEEQSLIEVGVVGTQKVLNLVFYKICVNIIIILANYSFHLDGTSYLLHVEDKVITVLIYLGSSNVKNNLITSDCTSTQ